MASRAVVTGASSGIGRELAQLLAKEGAHVLAVARRGERLATLADQVAEGAGQIVPFAADVTSADARRAIAEEVASRWGALDLLVNCAGVGAQGRFEHASATRLRQIMEVNFFALAELIRECLPLLRRGRHPAIVNVASVLGYYGVPFCSEYCASKAAVRAFSQSLRAELRREGIAVIIVSPGTTETEFFDRLLEAKESPAWPRHRGVSAQYVARATLRAIRRRKLEIVPYFWGKLFAILTRLAPRVMDRALSSLAQSPADKTVVQKT